MGYCVVNQSKGLIAWCRQYSSACMMAREFGVGTAILGTHNKFLRGFVESIRKSW